MKMTKRDQKDESLATLMMETVRTSDTLANLRQSTRRYNPNDSHFQIYICFHPALFLELRSRSFSYKLTQEFLSHRVTPVTMQFSSATVVTSNRATTLDPLPKKSGRLCLVNK
jgi:hypothetical protein